MTASLQEHTNGVISALETTDLPVGRAEAPDDPLPYYVVYPIPGGRVMGNLDDPHGDAELVYQVTCVGETSEQVELLVDKAMALLDGIEVPGRSISQVDIDTNAGVRRGDESAPPLFYATPRFTILSTPA